MDAQTFDRWTVAITRHPTRRTAVRLLAGGLLGGALARGGVAPAGAAQRPDRDGDGLYDDDELEVYGTNPDVYDTDGDGVGDGEEVYVGTDPLTPAGGAAPPPSAGAGSCPAGGCAEVDAPPPADFIVTCSGAGLVDCGGVCVDLSSDAYNCGYCGNPCPLGGFCQGGTCTGLICPDGLTDCGAGYCVHLLTNNSHCGVCGGACFNSLFGDYTCVNGSCV